VRTALDALLRTLLGERAVAVAAASRAWSSAGVCGERHRLELRLAGDAADALLEGLSEREFALDRHYVAEIAAVEVERQGSEARLVIEALTIPLD